MSKSKRQKCFVNGHCCYDCSNFEIQTVAERYGYGIAEDMGLEEVDSYANWLASISNVKVGEYCCYKTRYYDDKNDLEEEYYVDHEDELKYLEDNEIDMIIKERTSSWWKKAIIVYVDVPSDEEANDHDQP